MSANQSANQTASNTVTTNQRVIACDGGEGSLGHPRVWLRIKEHSVECPYCSKIFVLADGAGEDSGH